MSTPETLKKPITGEELLKMGDIGRCELVRGEIVRTFLSRAHQIGNYFGIYVAPF